MAQKPIFIGAAARWRLIRAVDLRSIRRVAKECRWEPRELYSFWSLGSAAFCFSVHRESSLDTHVCFSLHSLCFG